MIFFEFWLVILVCFDVWGGDIVVNVILFWCFLDDDEDEGLGVICVDIFGGGRRGVVFGRGYLRILLLLIGWFECWVWVVEKELFWIFFCDFGFDWCDCGEEMDDFLLFLDGMVKGGIWVWDES